VATGVIAGLGVDGYRLALEHLARFAGNASAPVNSVGQR
jgi:3-dehydroquinate dehydratase-2